MQEEVALDMFMTLEKTTEVVDDEEVPCLKFRLKNEEKVITYGEIGSLLGFKSNAYEMVQVEDGELDEFWTKIAKDVNRQRKNISNVTLQIFHSWLSKRILWEDERIEGHRPRIKLDVCCIGEETSD